MAEEDPAGIAPLRGPPQDRLQPDLRQLDGQDRTGRRVRLAQRAAAEGVHLVDHPRVQRTVPGERGQPAHLPELLQRRALFGHRAVESVLAVDPHRALVEVVRLRYPRGVRVPLHQQMGDAVVGQEVGGRQAASPAAHDQNWDLDCSHILPSTCVLRTSGMFPRMEMRAVPTAHRRPFRTRFGKRSTRFGERRTPYGGPAAVL